MTLTSLARAWIWAALPVGALVAGCDSGPDTGGTGDTQVATAELVGSIQFSATHDVKFWDYGNGMARIEENLHADLDRGAPLSMNKIDIEGRALSDVYKILAGANADPKVLEKLHALDLRVAAAARSTSTSTLPRGLVANGQGTVSGMARPPGTFSPETPSGPDGIEVRQGAATCAEPPGFDWHADGQWFANNFCGNDTPVYLCGWAAAAFTEEWSDRVGYYRSTGLNQSFCSGASYLVAERIRLPLLGIFQLTLINSTLPTRWVRNDAWTATSDAYFTSLIAATAGGTTVGLAIHEVRR